MSIKIIVSAKIKEEKLDEVIPFFKSILPDTRGFEGMEGISVCFNEEDPTNMVLVEKWASKEAYEKYHHWREENGSLDQIREFLAGRPDRMFLNITDA